MFDNNDKETIKNVSKDIINTTNDIINIDDTFPMETIVITDDVQIPSDRGIARTLDDLQTIDYNNDTSVNDIDD